MSTVERWEERIDGSKTYAIDRDTVYQAWLRVKANGGAAGVDGQSTEDFERKLEDNLYKLWNRMSSGSYIPKAVRLCPIPKGDGGERLLGIPTVSDRIAQMVGVLYLLPVVEPVFHADSYAYRPGKSAHDAIGAARRRSWSSDWVIDLDISRYFDTIDHELLMKAVRCHVQEQWLLMYIERWLKVIGVGKGGERVHRECGTPQGGVISPLLANLFLHYVFDRWMQKHFATILFERYADDIIVHCRTERQAIYVLDAIRRRLSECGLSAHPEKTKIVYCKDGNRRDTADQTKFKFLGFEFRGRLTRNNQTGEYFVGFTPAVSPQAKQSMRYAIRSWNLKGCAPLRIEAVAARINPVVRGWMNYYGRYCGSALNPIMQQVELALCGWAMKKYKNLRRRRIEAFHWLRKVRKSSPGLFVHWTAFGTSV